MYNLNGLEVWKKLKNDCDKIGYGDPKLVFKSV